MKKIVLCVTFVILAGFGYAVWYLVFDSPLGLPHTMADAAEASSVAKPPAGSEAADPPIVRVTLGERRLEGFPEQVTIHVGNDTFTAQYTGRFVRVRSILFVPVHLYAIASYLEAPAAGSTDSLLDGLLTDGPRKVYLLQFLKPLPGRQILQAIREEIELSFTDVDMNRVGQDIERFVQVFANGASKGDVVYMVWLPGGRVFCGFNTPHKIELVSSDPTLARAIWRIWAGPTAGPERVGLVERFASDRERK